MSFILVLLTAAVFVILELVKHSRSVKIPDQQARRIDLPVTGTIERYYHPGHSWARVGESDAVPVGVDDFAQKLIGRIDRIDLPMPGGSVKQGQVLATLRRGRKSLAQVAPISGIVVAVNEKLAHEPALVNESPYDRGWTVKISPSSLRLEIRNLLKGIVAERWLEAVRTELVHWFSPRPGSVLQDGGRLIENVSDQVDDEEWMRLLNEFFPLVPVAKNGSNSSHKKKE